MSQNYVQNINNTRNYVNQGTNMARNVYNDVRNNTGILNNPQVKNIIKANVPEKTLNKINDTIEVVQEVAGKITKFKNLVQEENYTDVMKSLLNETLAFVNEQVNRLNNRSSNISWEHFKGTFLCEQRVGSINSLDPLEYFGKRANNDPKCQVLVLRPYKSIFDWFTVVQDGYVAILSKWGRIVGEVNAGLHYLPPGTKIEFIVCTHHTPFDYPVKFCPTLDNVMVMVDILVVFQIVEATKFVLSIGPYKLSQIMTCFLEESIRSLCRSTFYHDAYDLRGKNLSVMQRSLNDKLKDFGVIISQITIVDVLLPKHLSDSMEQKTKYSSLMRFQNKKQEFDLKKQDNNDFRTMLDLKRLIERALEFDNNNKNLSILKKEIDEIEGIVNKRLHEVQVEASETVREIQYTGEKETAKIDGKKDKIYAVKIANGKLKSSIVNENTNAYVTLKRSETNLNVTTNKAKVIETISTQEGKSKDSLKNIREFRVKQKKLAVIDSLSSNKNVVLSGSSNHSELAQLIGFEGNINKSLLLGTTLNK